MGKSNNPATIAEQLLTTVKGEEYTYVTRLHNLGKQLGCKAEPGIGTEYYRVRYTIKPGRKQPKFCLFTIECNEQGWRVKAPLTNAAAYPELLEQCPTKVRDAIMQTPTCSGCDKKCTGGTHFKVNSKPVFPCKTRGHCFTSLTGTEWENVYTLLEADFKTRNF